MLVDDPENTNLRELRDQLTNAINHLQGMMQRGHPSSAFLGLGNRTKVCLPSSVHSPLSRLLPFATHSPTHQQTHQHTNTPTQPPTNYTNYTTPHRTLPPPPPIPPHLPSLSHPPPTLNSLTTLEGALFEKEQATALLCLWWCWPQVSYLQYGSAAAAAAGAPPDAASPVVRISGDAVVSRTHGVCLMPVDLC